MMTTSAERILGCLQGIAAGDAIGKQTETLSRADVLRWYPDGIRGFEGKPGDVIPRYVGNSKREWRIGETTDDTERTLAVARAILADGSVSHASIGREMLACVKCVHPGVKSLWEFHQAADPVRVAREHDGCGAAIRVAPVGIVYSSQLLDELVAAAHEASISTHGGPLAIAAAAATAASVSSAIEGAPAELILSRSLMAAERAESRWPGASGPVFADAVRGVHEDLASLPAPLQADEVAACSFPSGPLTIVPLALALAALLGSAEEAILLAANIGGDSDSAASIAGGILGARFPKTVNRHWCEVVEEVNRHDLASVADRLTALRRSRTDK